jgi:hypothetical protein
MKSIKSIIVIVILMAISLELYILLAGSQKFDVDFVKAQLGVGLQDVIPQSVNYPSGKINRDTRDHLISTDRFNEDVADGTYFAYYENGEIHPPKKYDVENNYSQHDIEVMKRALRIAYRYANINKAFEDGYFILNLYAMGMGFHIVNIDYILDNEASIEKPDFLNYVKNYKTGQMQLVQIGFITQGTTPYKLFDTEDARGHFHIGNYCYVLNDHIYVDYSVSKMIKDKSGNTIAPFIIQNSDIFDSIANSELIALDGNCEQDGGKATGSIWMMHFAVNIYNEYGMFADYSSYIDYLYANAITYSFFGN